MPGEGQPEGADVAAGASTVASSLGPHTKIVMLIQKLERKLGEVDTLIAQQHQGGELSRKEQKKVDMAAGWYDIAMYVRVHGNAS